MLRLQKSAWSPLGNAKMGRLGVNTQSVRRSVCSKGRGMRPSIDWKKWLTALILLALSAAARGLPRDQFTPVVVTPLTANTQPVLGTDGKYHVVYELVLMNAMRVTATLKKIEVLDANHPSRVIATFEGQELLSRLRTLGNRTATVPEIESNETRLLLIDLTFDSRGAVPRRLLHHLNLLGGYGPAATTPTPLSYMVAPFDITQQIPEIGPPLAGKGWVALNGCCGPGGAHRSTALPVNGRLWFAQRFAIDWMRLDDGGRLVHGDPSNIHNYADYGANVLAVADGTIVETLNTLNDQVPGKLPDPRTITLENVDGNHIVEDLGHGVYAFYAHLEKGSIDVEPGERVKRGQVLAKVGNTGNTSAPHLHFHLMDGPSVLGSSGIPYVIGHFSLAGQIPPAKDPAETEIEGGFNAYLVPHPSARIHQFPLNLAIVNFPP